MNKEERQELAMKAAMVGVGVGNMVADVMKTGESIAETFEIQGKVLLVQVSEYSDAAR